MNDETRKKNAERSKKWRESNPDYMKKYMKTYNEEHKEEMLEANRKYHQDNKAERNAYRRQWAKDNPEKDKAATDAWRAANPEKVKEGYLKRLYGITLVDYDVLFKKQCGLCAICKQPPVAIYFHVDHDHSTNQIRGLLCRDCNTGIGLLKDDVDRLRQAIEYLTTPSQ